METFPGSYEFTDSVETKKAWLSTFSTADGLAIWVDNATETYRFWDVVEQPDGAYRISNNHLVSESADGKVNAEGKFLGWRGSDADTRLYFVDPAAEGAGVDWAFVTEENYNAWVEAWTPMKDQFNAAAGLLTWIKTAEEKSIDVSDEKAIYANEDATVEALNAAVESIQVKIKNQLANGATVDNPADMTASVNNPGFADGKKTGWSGDDPAFGEGAAEYYQKNFELYQTLKGMPNGVYGVGVQGFYRTSFSGSSYGEWQNKIDVAAKVYAKSGADSLNTAMCYAWDFAQTGDLEVLKADGKNWKNANGEVAVDERGYIPDNMKAASYLFAASPDNYKKMAYVAVDNGELTIGLKKKDDVPGGSWTMFDNFTLSYFGTAPEAYQMALEKGMPAKTEYSTANVSKQYIDTYDVAYTLTATDKATFSAAVKAVADAKLTTSQIDEVILVGGSSRIPAVQTLVKNYFGKEPSKGVNPDEVVAVGASIQGAILNKEGGVGDIVLLDVTPLTLGIETLGGVMTKLIDANTTIPCRKSEVFSTAADNQVEVTIHVLQGERPRPMAAQNKSIGQFNLTGIAPARRGIPQIEVTFDIDANGILKVTAKDKATGKEQAIRIEASSGLTEEEINRMKAEAERNAEADKRERERIDKLNQADSMIFQTETFLNENGDKLGAERSNVEAAVQQLKDAHKSGDLTAIDNAMNNLNQVMQAASAKMYQQAGPGPQPGAEQTNYGGQQTSSEETKTDDNIQDADFEEVK